MKPFLLLATRAEDDVADEEYETVLRFSGLQEGRLHRVRLESGPMPPVDLERYSGVARGGTRRASGRDLQGLGPKAG